MNKDTEEFEINGIQFDDYIQSIYSKMVSTTRLGNGLPSNEEIKLLSQNDQKKLKNDTLSMKRTLSELHDEINFEDDEDMTDQFDNTVDLLDFFLEHVDYNLDQLDKPTQQLNTSKTTTQNVIEKKLQFNKILRPQEDWSDDYDNSNKNFVPKIKEKPNAQISLEESLSMKATDGLVKLGFGSGSGGTVNRDSHPHPYLYELNSLEYMDWQFKKHKEQIFLGLKNVPCTWVDTQKKLFEVLSKLEKESIIAIDLEQHSYRTFQGFVCLMQISTRQEDFLIDTLALRKHMHHLNSCFTNPKILKVLHGSENDILWLQRDFGLYIVNLFDTGQACRVLEFPNFSYAYLLKYFCGIEADKKYQLSDWRVRPLPNELISYARQDTHHLLYIYDRLRNLLCQEPQKKLMIQVLEKSKEICKSRYEKVLWTEASYLSYLKTNSFNKQQQEIFRRLFNWRDRIAREEDESLRYVLSDASLFLVAENLPKTIEKFFSMISPVPPLVRKYRQEIMKLIDFKEDQTGDGNKPIKQDAFEDDDVSMIDSQNEQDKAQDLFKSSGWVENSIHLNFNENGNSSDDEDDMLPRSHEKRTIEAIQESETSSLFDQLDDEILKNENVKSLYDSFSFDSIYPKKQKMNTPPEVSPNITSNENQPTISTSEKEQEKTEDVPKSLNEIYNISQKKRVGNKSKKILKQEAKLDPSPAYDGTQEKEKVVELETPVDFMKKIGWISKDEKELKKFNAANESSSSNQSESKKKSNQNDSSKTKKRHH
eukprot:gene6229-10235_t